MVERILSRLGPAQLVLVGCALRVAWIALCPNEPTSDQHIYHFSATKLSEGLGYIDQDGNPANFWPVGYPALLGFFYWAFGPDSRPALRSTSCSG
jgi:hypothetical protein